MHDANLPDDEPPSSPPSVALLTIKVIKHTTATAIKTTTLNPRDPAGT